MESCDPSNDGGRGEERGSYPPLYFFGFRLEITCLFLYLPVSLQAEAHAILTRRPSRQPSSAAQTADALPPQASSRRPSRLARPDSPPFRPAVPSLGLR